MSSNLVDFSKFVVDKQGNIDIEAAKEYFIREVLPYAGEDSLQRLIQADISGNPHSVKIEMMKMFVESELMRTTQADTNKIRTFFSNQTQLS